MGLPESELSLTLVNDPAMARFNRTLLNRRGTTNVISLPQQGGPFPGVQGQVLGDVIISLETTRRQARQEGWSFIALLDFYLIHGILHLVGFDHEQDEMEARRMADRALELMGLLHPDWKEDVEWPCWK